MISVIIYACNTEKYIERCVKSVLSQTYDNFEVIIVDDASSDDTAVKALRLADEDERVQVYGQVKKIGAANSKNAGIYHSSGDYILLMDSTDIMLPNALTKLVTAAKLNNADLVIGNVNIQQPLDTKTDDELCPIQDVGLQQSKYISVNSSTSIENMSVHRTKDSQIRTHKSEVPSVLCIEQVNRDAIYTGEEVVKCVHIISDISGNKLWKSSMISKYDIKFQDKCFCDNEVFYHYGLARSQTVVTIHDVILQSECLNKTVLGNSSLLTPQLQSKDVKGPFDLIRENYTKAGRDDFLGATVDAELMYKINAIKLIPWYNDRKIRSLLFNTITKNGIIEANYNEESVQLLEAYEKMKKKKFTYTSIIPVMVYRRLHTKKNKTTGGEVPFDKCYHSSI